MIKKVMSLLLVLSLVLSVALTGCGKQNQNTTPDQTTEGTEQQTPAKQLKWVW